MTKIQTEQDALSFVQEQARKSLGDVEAELSTNSRVRDPLRKRGHARNRNQTSKSRNSRLAIEK